tara:strand:+ start:664 stop:1251 length:588 start_codon:yes stop_codon:yes gene_type:complete
MQEQQGNLMPQLSGLPGPRPFKRGKTNMENKATNGNPIHKDGKPDWSKPTDATVDEIVARTSEAIASGKAFGGWTDDVEEQVRQGATIDRNNIEKMHKKVKGLAKAAMNRQAAANKKNDAPLVKIGPDSTRENPQYTKNIRPSDLKNEEVQQLDEILPLLGMAAGGLIKKAAGAVLGKVFKKSKNAGEESTAPAG